MRDAAVILAAIDSLLDEAYARGDVVRVADLKQLRQSLLVPPVARAAQA
jgi:hypothetical protein